MKERVIKALECCLKDGEGCSNCSYRINKHRCNFKKLLKQTLALLKGEVQE